MASPIKKCKLHVPGIIKLETENLTSATLIGILAMILVFLILIALLVKLPQDRRSANPQPPYHVHQDAPAQQSDQ